MVIHSGPHHFDAADLAVLTEKRSGARPIDSLTVVLLESAEVGACDGDQFLMRQAWGWSDGLEPEFFGNIGFVHIGDIVRPTTSRFEKKAFDFPCGGKTHFPDFFSGC